MKHTILALILIAAPLGANAVPIVVGGQLVGATAVDVSGTLYDVDFVDGIFNDIFGATPSFVADSFFAARQFGDALLNSVLLDGPLGMFDSRPELTIGCPDTTYCEILTPYAIGSVFPFDVSTNAAINLNIDSDNALNNFERSSTLSSVGRTYVWAVWTPTPVVVPVAEPGSLLMLATGLLAFGVFRRRETRKG